VAQQTLGAHRVLPLEPFVDLAHYIRQGGGGALAAARAVEPEALIAELEASGLRGRGGAGFPTGTKWRTIASYASAVLETAVIVNAAEGEPGTYKDRAILSANPYAVLEGALIAAYAMGSRSVTIATKARFDEVIARLRSAIVELRDAEWLGMSTSRSSKGPTNISTVRRPPSSKCSMAGLRSPASLLHGGAVLSRSSPKTPM